MRTWVWLVVAACGHSSDLSMGSNAPVHDGPTDAATMMSGVPYGSDGPVPYTVQTATLTAGTTFNITAYLPTTSGLHPAVSFAAGSQQTAAGYAPYGERLASYGIAAIIADDPGVLVNTGAVVTNAVYVVATYIPNTFADTIDTTRIGVAGHSRGGAASLAAA
ncbi:MAG TPA: hypothetical protein VH143_34525, partial [Kofleriaceae bacterium]|nr:hypothetical protein [Kofleriaceae bacterium]